MFTSWNVLRAIVEHTPRDAHGQRRLQRLRHRQPRTCAGRARCSSKRRRRGTKCGTTPTPSGLPWIISRATSRASSISRSARPTTGRTTAATIACSRRWRAATNTSSSSGRGCSRSPTYRGTTHILITTDHGRGHTPADWKGHGRTSSGSGETWMAFVSPSMSRRGEWSGGPPIVTAQVAATLITWMGGDWNSVRSRRRPAGALKQKKPRRTQRSLRKIFSALSAISAVSS